ncbi:MAG: ROK family protein [Rhizobiales bacterium]|nr:ROK family protein [Hyphomicrobiales bacterium]NRB13489.1 ROK family protein [Hyphomicrobiales bacterium]
MHGAIDLGGTKIEAALLNDQFEILKSQRVATPADSYENLLAAIELQINWLKTQSPQQTLNIGIGVPGFVDQQSGIALTSNLPAAGQMLRKDIAARAGQFIPMDNDCRCFALSEANGGAGNDFKKVVGLIVGTGIGGGTCVNGKLDNGLNSLPIEIGHLPIPHRLIESYKLPVLKCGCGRIGCFETLVSGDGMSRLAKHFVQQIISGEDIVLRAQNGDAAMTKIFEIWLDIYCHMLDVIHLMLDPDCIILGGGTSKIDNLAQKLTQKFQKLSLKNTKIPTILTAKYGDSSGVRGAAMLNI